MLRECPCGGHRPEPQSAVPRVLHRRPVLHRDRGRVAEAGRLRRP